MKTSRHHGWIFALCAVLALAALGGISSVVLRLERAGFAASAEAEHQERLRLALWRMDSWLAPFLAQEAARSKEEYRAFFAQQDAYTRFLSPIEPGEVLAPSPLLTFESEYFSLHFQVNAESGLSSPQLPTGSLLELARSKVPETAWHERRKTLERVAPVLDPARIGLRVTEAEAAIRERLTRFEAAAREPLTGSTEGCGIGCASPATAAESATKTEAEYGARVSCTVGPQRPPATVGPLLPLWLDAPPPMEDAELVFLRRVQADGKETFQGFVGNWPRLRDRLLQETRDVLPGAAISRVPDVASSTDPSGSLMATLPVALSAPRAGTAVVPWATPARLTLLVTWIVAGIALVMAAATVRKSIELGNRRQRFVSAVTHELRTPLTTFRMYSDMLAGGMVEDENAKQDYLNTLKEESARLATMVENVLAYARLEEGRMPRRRARLTVDGLLERLSPQLSRRATEAGMQLSVEAGEASGELTVEVDVDAIGQILFNLVDNAGKYAGNSTDPTIHLEASLTNGALTLRVRDHGPGIPARLATAVFEPFERGERDATDPVPGVGLGLELSRGLAREMGGELTLERPDDDGATFRLFLPDVVAA